MSFSLDSRILLHGVDRKKRATGCKNKKINKYAPLQRKSKFSLRQHKRCDNLIDVLRIQVIELERENAQIRNSRLVINEQRDRQPLPENLHAQVLKLELEVKPKTLFRSMLLVAKDVEEAEAVQSLSIALKKKFSRMRSKKKK